MPRLQQDKFRVFVSHKHADKEFADLVAANLESLAPDTIECWVSGQDLTGGVDWNREIKAHLAQSHLLVLLFTTAAHNWDWCLYEVGLFVRFEAEEVSSVLCIFDPKGSPPGPLRQVQGVAAERDALVTRFLRPLCSEPWRVSDDWQRGPLVAEPDIDELNAIADRIAGGFAAALAATEAAQPELDVYTYRPCHRIVLEFDPAADRQHIPLDARVVQGADATTSYTLSLFRAFEGRSERTWGQLVEEAGGKRAPWLAELDEAFALGLKQRLWTPKQTRMEVWDPDSDDPRFFLPVLYEIKRRSTDDAAVGATIVLTHV